MLVLLAEELTALDSLRQFLASICRFLCVRWLSSDPWGAD